jgi:hypothetical protein
MHGPLVGAGHFDPRWSHQDSDEISVFLRLHILRVLCFRGAGHSVLVSPGLYYEWYWPTQFAILVAGCGVILEILRHVLEWYPGAERVARLASL